jgi:low affinity Fe/Cu permease
MGVGAYDEGMGDAFRKFAFHVAEKVGHPWAFVVALCIIVAWAAAGPLFGFSDTWQLVINTGTTIITFLMVFLIQASQNRDNRAMQLKLDELIRAVKRARDEFADLEEAEEEELKAFAEEFRQMRKRGHSPKEALSRAAHRRVPDEKV